MSSLLVTGGAGFIGSNLVRHLLAHTAHRVINVDKLTYAGNLESLRDVLNHPRHTFLQVDICDAAAVRDVFATHRPDAVLHLAAESHVDRSIDGPGAFIQTNVIGTFNLLEAARHAWHPGSSPLRLDRGEGQGKVLTPSSVLRPPSASLSEAPSSQLSAFRFVHVSTDEVFGSLGPDDPAFHETTAYAPRSPYSASKAASDQLARAWHHTYGLPVIVTNCSNNYGPYQFPEKLIPVVILKALRGEPIPVYGTGENIRDWLYVEDHCAALTAVLERGRVGETYCIGGNHERRNIDLVRDLCRLVDEERSKLGTRNSERGNPKAEDGEQKPDTRDQKAEIHTSSLRPHPPEHSAPAQLSTLNSQPSTSLITFVPDRPGHDFRYAIDTTKITRELGWSPRERSDTGLRKTVRWYLENRDWWQRILDGSYRLERMGKAHL